MMKKSEGVLTRVLPTIDHGTVINNIAHQKYVEIHS
jgi:hypothetical protein